MLYGAYGANTSHDSMGRRCPDAKFICNGVLERHELVFRGVADIVDSDDNMEIAIWEISERDERSLDGFEGYPNLYTKKHVFVETDSGVITCMVYIMRDADYILNPSKSYYDLLLSGYEDCDMSQHQVMNAQGSLDGISEYVDSQYDWGI